MIRFRFDGPGLFLLALLVGGGIAMVIGPDWLAMLFPIALVLMFLRGLIL